MVTNMTIDVILPTYNGVNFLEEQIESIYFQTLRPTRLVMVTMDQPMEQEVNLRLQLFYGSWLHVLPSGSNVGCVANINLLLAHLLHLVAL